MVANSALYLVSRGALVHEIGVYATLLDDKITYHISLLATHECLIHVKNLARREQDEVDEPNEGNIVIIVSIYPKL